MKRKYFFVLLAAIAYFAGGCKTPQKTAVRVQEQAETTAANNITLTAEDHSSGLLEKTARHAASELLDIGVVTVQYDTDKPADTVTGRHPVKSESFFKLRKRRDKTKLDTLRKQRNNNTYTNTTDRSRIQKKARTDNTEKKTVGLNAWQAVSAATVASLLIFLFLKYKVF